MGEEVVETAGAIAYPNFRITDWGAALNTLFEVTPRLTLITANYYNNGGGDYIFGEAPDLIIQATGAPSLVPSGSTVDGLEYNPTLKWSFWTTTEEHGSAGSRHSIH